VTAEVAGDLPLALVVGTCHLDDTRPSGLARLASGCPVAGPQGRRQAVVGQFEINDWSFDNLIVRCPFF
jgi:hypothetical protein